MSTRGPNGCGPGEKEKAPSPSSRTRRLARSWIASGARRLEFRFGHTCRRVHFHGHGELPLLPPRNRADAHDLTTDFLAALVGDRHGDRVLQRLVAGLVSNRAFDAEGREGGDGLGPTTLSETKVLTARRTDARALQNDRPAVRAGSRRAGRRPPNAAHEA